MSNFLRPPGVVSEKDLKSRCISCGQCAQVCNYHCIELTPDYLFGPETPKVFQQKSPCWLCMKCSAICPTDALRDVPIEESGMGLAFLNLKKCVDYQEEAMVMCWTCYDRCPLRGKAIVLEGGYIPSVTDACVGCGVCEYVCPIDAITVTPQRQLGLDGSAKSESSGHPADDKSGQEQSGALSPSGSLNQRHAGSKASATGLDGASFNSAHSVTPENMLKSPQNTQELISLKNQIALSSNQKPDNPQLIITRITGN